MLVKNKLLFTMTAYCQTLTRTTLGQLCSALWDSQSRPVVIQPGIEPGPVVTPLALRCSALDRCATREYQWFILNSLFITVTTILIRKSAIWFCPHIHNRRQKTQGVSHMAPYSFRSAMHLTRTRRAQVVHYIGNRLSFGIKTEPSPDLKPISSLPLCQGPRWSALIIERSWLRPLSWLNFNALAENKDCIYFRKTHV